MSRHKHYHIPDREARRAAQLAREPTARHRQTDIAESRHEFLSLPPKARGYAVHQGQAEKARRLAVWLRDSRVNPDSLATMEVDPENRGRAPLRNLIGVVSGEPAGDGVALISMAHPLVWS